MHHVSLNVADVQEAERFYIDVLGLKKLPRPDFGFPGTWLACADGRQVHLLGVDGHQAPKGQHFAFHVTDIDDACTELQDQGIKVADISEIPGGGRQTFFKDPSGNLIELNSAAIGWAPAA